jgi:hypothetical protein
MVLRYSHDVRGGDRKRLFSLSAGRKKLFLSVVLAALPLKQPKKIVISLLPQARNACCGVSNRADGISPVIRSMVGC